MVATTLAAGDVAIVSYETQLVASGASPDALRFVLLRPIGSGTQIFISDRAWNGTAFAGASAGEGTYTYTAGADLPAGTVITITGAQLSTAGITLSVAGEAIFVYQGSGADAPTTFLSAIEVADDNSTFNATLAGTGLTVGTNAPAVQWDNARFQGQSTEIPQSQILKISDTNQWHGSDAADIHPGTIYDDTNDTTLSGPLRNPDMQLFVVNNGGGQSDAIVRIDNDEAANVGTNLTRLFRDNPAFARLEDIAFDVEDGYWFAADNEGSDITSIIRGNIADLVTGNPNPTIIVIYDIRTTAAIRTTTSSSRALKSILWPTASSSPKARSVSATISSRSTTMARTCATEA